MKYAFIDYENVNSLDGLNLQEYDRTFLFIGSVNNQLRLTEKFNDEINITLITVKDISKNNVDFHLAYYLGKLDISTDKNIEFHILSNDKGFDGICQFIQHQREPRICFRKAINQTEEKIALPLLPSQVTNVNNAEKEKIVQVAQEFKAFISKVQKRSLPVKLATLKNSIYNQTSLKGVDKKEADKLLPKIIDQLVQKKLIKVNENKVSYP
ncbi:PIN domain-containing protein [Glaesserella parasuis]|uniref:PIN domain-containing protein n=1 Tax=Glaesserella parasuis TaxID=738 RepID=UPI00094FEF2E|nr:PIN domain-containing protein [Glaesserella parasuis]MDG6281715.1 PIN domain-containing protein [Glaesserella parasuis]MDG6324292.1 PIN domain-containing protein [Glaesserella parasuis]MDG6363106.1 PIN domain-containing protein [Glaesserella parasuis]MDG6454210.1 PIN domain-containing protein [Glaesserella parasuis]MDO9843946.1 PIN domain-containing protein [Glaesserella parasuis]